MVVEFLIFISGVVYVIYSIVSSKRAKAKLKQYDASIGFKITRQSALERMATNNAEEFEKLSGYGEKYGHRPRNYWEKRDAVKDIAKQEGWAYFDSNARLNDPKRRKIMDKIK